MSSEQSRRVNNIKFVLIKFNRSSQRLVARSTFLTFTILLKSPESYSEITFTYMITNPTEL